MFRNRLINLATISLMSSDTHSECEMSDQVLQGESQQPWEGVRDEAQVQPARATCLETKTCPSYSLLVVDVLMWGSLATQILTCALLATTAP